MTESFGPGVGESTVRRLSTLLNEESALPHRVDVVAFELCENAALKVHIRGQGKVLSLNEQSSAT